MRFGKNLRGEPLSQSELQQDVQRFASGFSDRIVEAAETVDEHGDPAVREALMRQVLLWVSSAIDIASGPLPEVNALDMTVFLSLSHDSLDQYWNPQVFGDDGRPLSVVFAESKRELEPIMVRLLDDLQRGILNDLIRSWKDAHPNQHRVESVRLYQFAAVVGSVTHSQAQEASGLLAQVKAATRAADQAVLLGDRAMFLVHRMPSLMRLQARLGLQQTISDAERRLDAATGVLDQMPQARALLLEVRDAANSSMLAARESRGLIADAQPLLDALTKREPGTEMSPPLMHALETVDRLADKTLRLVDQIQALSPGDPTPALAAAEQHVDRLVRRWIGYLMLLGVVWAAVFWGGYYVAKRHTQPRSTEPASSSQNTTTGVKHARAP